MPILNSIGGGSIRSHGRGRSAPVTPPRTISQLYSDGEADGVYPMTAPSGINGGVAFDVRYASYDNKGWIEIFISRESYGAHLTWVHQTNAGYDGLQNFGTSYGLRNTSLVDGGLDYTAAHSILLLGPSFNGTDMLFTDKTSMAANGITTNESYDPASVYPLRLSSDLQGSSAGAAKTAMLQYFEGTHSGLSAQFGYTTNASTRMYSAYWSKGTYKFSTILSNRTGIPQDDHWYVVNNYDGSGGSTLTYFANYGYRGSDGSGSHDSAHVGAWVGATTGSIVPPVDSLVDSGNVMSIWITNM